MIDAARNLSARVCSLEALNTELEARLELLETHEPRPPLPQAVPDEPTTEAEEEVETEQLPTSDAHDSVQEQAVGRKQKTGSTTGMTATAVSAAKSVNARGTFLIEGD